MKGGIGRDEQAAPVVGVFGRNATEATLFLIECLEQVHNSECRVGQLVDILFKDLRREVQLLLNPILVVNKESQDEGSNCDLKILLIEL